MTPTARRFESIIDAGVLNSRDIVFAQSLYSYYKRKGKLTSGRRKCLAGLEDRVADLRANPPAKVVASPETIALLARIDALKGASTSDWETEVLASFREQLEAGRVLSPKQITIIDKVEKVAKEVAEFDFDETTAKSFAIAVAYYRNNPPYYSNVVAAADGDPNYVPAPHILMKMISNKFVQKVIKVSNEPSRFAPGQMVAFNSTVTNNTTLYRRYCRLTGANAARNPLLDLKGMILKGDTGPVVSPAKGAKPILVLFFGQPSPISVEERFLKKAKKKGKR
jgi:hypothetical protein